jgi:hypothetical protein
MNRLLCLMNRLLCLMNRLLCLMNRLLCLMNRLLNRSLMNRYRWMCRKPGGMNRSAESSPRVVYPDCRRSSQ